MNPFTDPRFAGLHWSIDPNTPDEDREMAHLSAAMKAWRERELKEYIPYLRTHQGLVDTIRDFCLGCNKSFLEIHAKRLRCTK